MAWAPLFHSGQSSAVLLWPETMYWAASSQMAPELGVVLLLPRSAVESGKILESDLVGLCASGRNLGEAPRMVRPALVPVEGLVP